MSTVPQPSNLSQHDMSDSAVRTDCAHELDRLMHSLTPEGAEAFLRKWGEGLRTSLLKAPPHGDGCECDDCEYF